jgi:RHS repeat-associated protein
MPPASQLASNGPRPSGIAPFMDSGKENSAWYYRARYYDPAEGRLISEDPIHFGAGLNFYSYVRNNSVNRKDPTGLWQVTIGGGEVIGALVTFGSNSGQWNFGLYSGVGEGLFGRLDLSDSGGCHKFGANGAMNIDLEIPGGYAGVDATIDASGYSEGQVRGGVPGVGGLAWNPAQKPLEPPHGVLFGGSGLFGGVGFNYYSPPPSACGCH